MTDPLFELFMVTSDEDVVGPTMMCLDPSAQQVEYYVLDSETQTNSYIDCWTILNLYSKERNFDDNSKRLGTLFLFAHFGQKLVRLASKKRAPIGGCCTAYFSCSISNTFYS